MASSLLEYARHHRLATDHRAVDLTLSPHLDAVTENELELPRSSSSLGTHLRRPLPRPREPKLRLKKSELDFLAAGLRTPPLPPWDDILPDRHRIRELKLETPLLVADHEAEQNRSAARPCLDLEAHGLVVPELCDGAQSKRTDTKTITHEKFPATKQDLMSLKRILQDPYTSEAYQQLRRDALPERPCTNMFRSLDEDETELEEDGELRDLETQITPVLPQGPSFAKTQFDKCPVFSATQSLLNFMSTRGDRKLASSNSDHFAAVQTGEGIL